MSKIVSYLRVSTGKQEKVGNDRRVSTRLREEPTSASTAKLLVARPTPTPLRYPKGLVRGQG
jgi:hypothetical protein